MPRDLAVRAVSANQDLCMIAPAVGCHLDTSRHVTERLWGLPFVNFRTSVSCLLNQVMIEPITHDHIGDWTGRFDRDGFLTPVQKLKSEDGVFDDGFEPWIKKLLDPDRQTAAADLVPWVHRLVEPEHRQTGSTQLIGSSRAGRPHADNHSIVEFDIQQSGHGEESLTIKRNVQCVILDVQLSIQH
jgi:hypothetical protein